MKNLNLLFNEPMILQLTGVIGKGKEGFQQKTDKRIQVKESCRKQSLRFGLGSCKETLLEPRQADLTAGFTKGTKVKKQQETNDIQITSWRKAGAS